MAQFQNLVIKDAAGTDNTFTPRGVTGGVATWVKSTGVPIGEKKLSVSINRTATGRTKVQTKLAVPIVQDVTVAGVSKPTVVRTAYADLTFSFDGSSGTMERHDMISFLINALQQDGPFKAIRDLESLY